VSLIILFKSPLPISSPACTGTTVNLYRRGALELHDFHEFEQF
jgi:hypothetical protein